MNRMIEIRNLSAYIFGKLLDFLILNLLFWITCLPVITMGAGFTALYEQTVSSLRQSRGYMIRGYFQSMKKHGVVSTVLWIVALLIDGMSILGVVMVGMYVHGGLGALLESLYFAILIISLLLSCYAFPMISREEGDAKTILKRCLYTIGTKGTTTVMMVGLSILYVSLLAISFWMLPLLFLLVPGGMMLLISLVLEPVIGPKQLESEEKILGEEEQVDGGKINE